MIIAFIDEVEVQPSALVTINEYVAGERPVTVVLVPVPLVVIEPGKRVNVHVPDAGKSFSTTLPVGSVQVGCITLPIVGADGIALTVSE